MVEWSGVETSNLPTSRPPRFITRRLLEPALQSPSFALAAARIRIAVAAGASFLTFSVAAACGRWGHGAVGGFGGAGGLVVREGWLACLGGLSMS